MIRTVALAFLLALPLAADELDDLVAKFESERAKPYAERTQTASQFARLKGDRARDVLVRLYRDEKDVNIQNLLLRAVAAHEGPAARGVVLEALGDFAKPALQNTAAQSIEGKIDAALARRVVELLADARTTPNLATLLRRSLVSTRDESALVWLVDAGLSASHPAALLAVIETLGRAGRKDALPALEKLLRRGEPEIQRAAVDAIGGIADPAARALLSKLADSRDPEIATRAIRGLARWAREDPKLAEELLKDVLGSNVERKIAAADALAEAGVASAGGALVGLLDHREWRVRATAILGLRRLRAKEGIGPLIDRIEKEEGRLQDDVIDALEDLTGQSFGFSPANWQGWWRVNGPTFVVPPVRDPKAPPPAGDGGSSAGYYGIRVNSKRVVFVIDESGSMSAAANPAPAASTGAAAPAAPAKNRLDVAKEQLESVIDGFRRDVQFNLVFFDNAFKPWQTGLIPATDANKQAAIEYARSRQPRGGTNIYDPLEAAVLMEGVDTVFLLTDGDPGAGKFVASEDIIREIARINGNRRVKIHAIALGGTRALLQALARESGGKYVEAN